MPANKNLRVLIIDDNRAIHEDFLKILCPATLSATAVDDTEAAVFGPPAETVRQNHFEVDSAYQGQEGVLLVEKAMAAGLPYAVAFVDVRMPPGWDGVETTRRIWDLDPNLQIVLCTAYADYSWDQMFETLGNRDGLLILKKPFDSVEALQLAHALTEKSWLHEQARAKMGELETLVGARTAELRQSNQALQAEVAGHERAEAKLRESEEQFRQLAENIDDVFWMVSPDLQTFHYVSPAYELIWGRPASSLHAHPREWMEAIHPGERERVYAGYSALAGGGTSVSLEYQITRPDGAVRWIHGRAFPVRDAAGKVIRVAGIATDISRRKRLETHLLQSQKMETVGRLAGGVAHEFNSIMTVIIGHSELLLDDLAPDDPAGRSVDQIRKSAERAAALTRQLLAYGRKQMLQPEVLDLNSVLAGMETTLRHLMGKNTDVRVIPSARLKAVQVDAGQIEQVIMNLAMNSADAMPHGGKLTLETANVTLDQEYVSRFPELKAGNYVMLAVTDTGAGMTEETNARVFEPFFTTKEVGQGTGLGLSASYGIIKQSGGHISVYSEPARGATFKIYLPEIEPPASIPKPRPKSTELPRGTETILLAEDDPGLREMEATLLRRLGYTVLAAANGLEALQMKQQRDTGHVDLLFTDVVMPHMSGAELSDRVRALYPHTKVLFTSAYTENAVIHQGVLNKGVALLQKPFTPSDLAHKLREVLDTPGPEARSRADGPR